MALSASASSRRLLEWFRDAAVWLRPLTSWVVGAWLAGSVFWFAVAVTRIRRFQRLQLQARTVSDELQTSADRLARQIGIRHCPQVWLVDARISPMLWGAWGRAQILLPRELMERLSRNSREAVILHELAHFHRGDHLVRLFEMLCIGCFWWHPGVWIARRELQRAEEECCDAWVVSRMSHCLRDYAEALIQAVEFASKSVTSSTSMPPGASAISAASLLKRRVLSIMNGQNKTKLSWRGRIAVLAMAVTLLPFLPILNDEARSQTVAPAAETNADPDQQIASDTRPQPAEGAPESTTPAGGKARSVVVYLTVEHDSKTKTDATFLRVNGKNYSSAEFIRKFDSIVAGIEEDESRLRSITMRLVADKAVSTGQIQKIIELAQSAGFEKFALQATGQPDGTPDATETPKHLRLELLADFEGRLASLNLDGRDLGTGRKAHEALVKQLTSDKQIHYGKPYELIVIHADDHLVYSDVVQVIDTVSKLRMPDGKTPLVAKMNFAVQKKLPDVQGVVIAVREQPARLLAEISIGADDGLKKGHCLFVYRTNWRYQAKQYLGRIRLESVQPDSSVGVIVLNEKAGPIKRGDQVVSLPPKPPATDESSALPIKPAAKVVARVRLVDHDHQVLWINLGAVDGVTPRATFEIRARPEKDRATGNVKGTVTVTRILSGHLSEARIESETDNNRIMPGDVLVPRR